MPSYSLNTGLIIRDDNDLYIFDVKKAEYTLLYEFNVSLNSFAVDPNNTIFWCETNQLKYRSLLDTTQKNSSLLFEDWRVNPRGIAIDYITGNLYVVDELMGSLFVIDTQTKLYSLILTDLKNPYDILLDPDEGLMFILQLSSRVILVDFVLNEYFIYFFICY